MYGGAFGRGMAGAWLILCLQLCADGAAAQTDPPKPSRDPWAPAVVTAPAPSGSPSPPAVPASPTRSLAASPGKNSSDKTSAAKTKKKPQRPAHKEAARTDGPIVAVAAELSGDDRRTLFQLDLSKRVAAEVFTLAKPYRVIIDLPEVTFRLPDGAGADARGLVTAFRFGLFAEGKARIVLDTSGPVKAVSSKMEPVGDGSHMRLAVELVPISTASFGEGSGARGSSSHAKPSLYDDAPAKPKARSRPVIIVDPGHGGIDPGAVGPGNLKEKNVALAVARQLKSVLTAKGRYDVVLTRSDDVFVSLDERLAMSHRNAADLFISIHADSLAVSSVTQTVRGATVYTLSERASDEQARRMAEKENASDLLAGLESTDAEAHDQVRNILIDLLKRETADFSADFSNLVVDKLGKSISMARDPQRSAAFRVLKQTNSPSVLIELGYMSHAEDAKLLVSADWQKRVAASIATAVDSYFAKRTARK